VAPGKVTTLSLWKGNTHQLLRTPKEKKLPTWEEKKKRKKKEKATSAFGKYPKKVHPKAKEKKKGSLMQARKPSPSSTVLKKNLAKKR